MANLSLPWRRYRAGQDQQEPVVKIRIPEERRPVKGEIRQSENGRVVIRRPPVERDDQLLVRERSCRQPQHHKQVLDRPTGDAVSYLPAQVMSLLGVDW